MIGDRQREELLLRRYARTLEPAVLDELVRRLSPFARSLVTAAYRRHADLDDLHQVADLGLVQAIKRYDPARGVSFSSFAVPTIRGELRRHLRNTRGPVRPPRGLQEAIARNNAAIAELEPQLGRAPTAAEIARHSGASESEVMRALEASSRLRPVRLDQPVAPIEDSTTTAAELVGERDRGFDAAEIRQLIDAARLDERRRAILRMRFAEDLTQAEIGERIGVSQMQVSRLLRAALAAVREQASGAVEALEQAA